MNCDPLARWYRWLEYAGIGRALERRRFEFLPEVGDARRVLILGEGDGRFLAAFLRVNGHAEIDVVDNSAEMLAAACRRAGQSLDMDAVARRVRFHHADARAWPLPVAVRYDLIVTHFFLDCFGDEEVEELVRRCAESAAQGCRWLVSEFRQPARGLAAWRARVWIGGLYRLFGWATGLRVRRLPNHASPLERNGFRLTRRVVTNLGLLTSEQWTHAGFFAFDAPADAPLHSRTPKS